MYSDNETDVDLLGFEDQVHNLVDLITDPGVLPVTAGVLADWGAGKSSLLKMAARSLRERGVIVVEFSPWRIETYDDAKTAFLSAVIEQVAEHLPAQPVTARARRAVEKLTMLRRRVKWMRVAGLAAKKVITMSAPSLDELDALLRSEDEVGDQPSTESVSRDFRDEFEDLVAGLEGQTVAVLVDDLDRSLPEQVPEILQAIRLFLSVPGTAFVLATDERVVRDAIRLRYPQATETSETDLASEYLEKIVQVPVRIPLIGAAEAESYLNLLVAQRHFDQEQFAACLAKAREIRASGTVSVSMNLGLAREAVGAANVGDDAEDEFALMGRAARLLAAGLKGNPRQLKRYLNGFEMRWLTAQRRRLDLDRGVLAKLMVLEYAYPGRYRDLHQWTTSASDSSPVLAALEDQAREALGVVETPWQNHGETPNPGHAESSSGGSRALAAVDGERPASDASRAGSGHDGNADAPRADGATQTGVPTPKRPRAGVARDSNVPDNGDRVSHVGRTTDARGSAATTKTAPTSTHIPPEVRRWLESEWELGWLALEPRLSDVDLGPYFELGRAALPALAVRARTLPVALQRLLQQMSSATPEIRDTAADQAAHLDLPDAASLADAATDRLASEAEPGNLIQALATLTATHPSLIPGFLRALRGVPFDSLKAGLPLALARRLKASADPTDLAAVLAMWAEQGVNRRLATSARQALERPQ
jgi:hypothetical protein